MRLLALSLLLILAPLSFAGVIWSTTATDAVEGVAIAQGNAIFNSYDGSIYAADADTGQLSWVYDSGSRISLAPQLIDQGTVAVATDNGSLLLLSAKDGRLEQSAALNGTPLSLGSGLGMAFVGSGHGIAAYTQTGRLVWSRNFPEGVGQIGYGDNDVYFVSGATLYSLSAISGTKVWSAKAEDSFLSAPSEYGGSIYVGATDGRLYSFDYATGNLQWAHQTGGWVMSSAAATTTSVYFGSNDGYFYSVPLSGAGENWKFRTGEAIWSAPIIHQAGSGLLAVFGSNDGNIYALDTRTGEQVWAFSAGGKPTALAEYNGAFIFGTSAGKVYSISASPICSFTWPASGDVVGNWSVDVEGTAHSDSGLQKVDVRMGSGPWETASGTDTWYAPVDFGQAQQGGVTVQCRASDSSGTGRETDYSSLQLVVSDIASTQKMAVSAPQEAGYNESFIISAKDSRGNELHGVSVKVGDASAVKDSPVQVVLGKTGQVPVSLEKPGFDTYYFTVNGTGGSSPVLPLLAVAAIAALAYFFVRKRLPSYLAKK